MGPTLTALTFPRNIITVATVNLYLLICILECIRITGLSKKRITGNKKLHHIIVTVVHKRRPEKTLTANQAYCVRDNFKRFCSIQLTCLNIFHDSSI